MSGARMAHQCPDRAEPLRSSQRHDCLQQPAHAWTERARHSEADPALCACQPSACLSNRPATPGQRDLTGPTLRSCSPQRQAPPWQSLPPRPAAVLGSSCPLMRQTCLRAATALCCWTPATGQECSPSCHRSGTSQHAGWGAAAGAPPRRFAGVWPSTTHAVSTAGKIRPMPRAVKAQARVQHVCSPMASDGHL